MLTTMKAEDFIVIWQKAKTLEEVAEKAGIQMRSAANRASWLRNKGVPLKMFRERTEASIADLAALARLHAPKR